MLTAVLVAVVAAVVLVLVAIPSTRALGQAAGCLGMLIGAVLVLGPLVRVLFFDNWRSGIPELIAILGTMAGLTWATGGARGESPVGCVAGPAVVVFSLALAYILSVVFGG